MKISITITAEEKNFIELIEQGTAEETINRVVTNWLDDKINSNFQAKVKRKTRQEKINEINTQ